MASQLVLPGDNPDVGTLLMKHDNGTYTHSVNVCTYAMLLAERLGFTKAEDLAAIAVGGLLHDIGKRRIQLRILNKPGAFTDQERRHIQQHPHIGFTELFLRKDIHWGALMMVYQHHEQINGSHSRRKTQFHRSSRDPTKEQDTRRFSNDQAQKHQPCRRTYRGKFNPRVHQSKEEQDNLYRVFQGMFDHVQQILKMLFRGCKNPECAISMWDRRDDRQ